MAERPENSDVVAAVWRADYSWTSTPRITCYFRWLLNGPNDCCARRTCSNCSNRIDTDGSLPDWIVSTTSSTLREAPNRKIRPSGMISISVKLDSSLAWIGFISLGIVFELRSDCGGLLLLTESHSASFRLPIAGPDRFPPHPWDEIFHGIDELASAASSHRGC